MEREGVFRHSVATDCRGNQAADDSAGPPPTVARCCSVDRFWVRCTGLSSDICPGVGSYLCVVVM